MEKNNLEDFRTLWQNQPIANRPIVSAAEKLPDMISQLKQFEKKQSTLIKVKIILVSILLLLYVCMFYDKMLNSVYIITGMAIVFISSLSLFIIYWKNLFRISDDDFILDSITFVETITLRLNKEKKFIQVYLPSFLLLLIIGLNIIYIGLLDDVNFITRLLEHLAATVLLVAAGMGGRKIRIRRFEKKFQPLINSLESIKGKLQNENK